MFKCSLCKNENGENRLVIHASKKEWRDSQGMDLCEGCFVDIMRAIQVVIRNRSMINIVVDKNLKPNEWFFEKASL